MKNRINSTIIGIIRLIQKPIVSKITLLALGFMSTAWFLIRVIPKPQRATYPCMRASAPMMSAFVIYLLTFFSSVTAFRAARKHFARARYLYATLFLCLALFCTGLFFFGSPTKMYAKAMNSLFIEVNKPIGVAKGIFPGRVAWAHNPKAAQWDGTTGYWWDDKYNPQVETDKLMTSSLLTLTGQKSEAGAWESLFKYFNTVKKRGGKGYQLNETIAIKINENNTESHANTNEINASPQLVLSLLRSLINEAGVPQKNITVFDASRFITDNIFTKCHAEYPDVRFVDNVGGNGRIKSTYVDNAIPYSVDNEKLARGLAHCVVDADYLIDMALLKGHVGQGVTLCAKNYYGCTSIFNDWKLNAHNNFDQDKSGKAKYMTFTDFLGHKDLGQKTVLFLIDGIYGNKLVNGVPGFKWEMSPFNNNWPASLFASQDPVAIDAVGTDFIINEWPDAADLKHCDQYLIESALANNPPSGTHYDPERDGTGLESLGVFEHWNNARDKQYSGNLKTGHGIELIYKRIK
ncbi:DUF362 domain-containing protein [uncultured Bacteroides sp.]|uniref:DUF362 domain-containing protein n=1 Tax=uncultured Bacteroides sp. TaxID=162156 RepID=UPI002AA91665|nr:DUF362 domain-containing protein [uncultured Bacteroides sp.]